jgi:RNA polymerase sigma factor (sigma-70 family)
MQSTDDNALLNEYVKSHSDEAFAGLVTRHINLVYSVALRQASNPSHAEEIAQAVFIILAKKAASLRHEKALSSWLFQTTRLTANNFIRSEMRRHRREQEAYMQSLFNESGDAIWQEIGPALDDAVDALSAGDRQAILLRYYEGRSLRDVGVILGVSKDASEKRVARALEKLRKNFFKRGLPSAAAAIVGSISTNSVHAAPAGLVTSVTAIAIKGAAVPSSTLILTETTLKLMAWTKLKTAIVVGAAALLVAGTATVTLQQLKAKSASAHYTFAGYATPEASVQSMIWAAGTGDLEKLPAGVTSEEMDQFRSKMAGKSPGEISNVLVSWANAMAGYQITQKEVISDDEVHIHIHATPSADALHSGKAVIRMKKIGDEWKWAGDVN